MLHRRLSIPQELFSGHGPSEAAGISHDPDLKKGVGPRRARFDAGPGRSERDVRRGAGESVGEGQCRGRLRMKGAFSLVPLFVREAARIALRADNHMADRVAPFEPPKPDRFPLGRGPSPFGPRHVAA